MKTNIFTLDSKVAIYVPSTNNVSELDKNALQYYFENLILSEFSEMFGGATAQKAVGGWLSEKNGLIKEDVTIIYSFCKDSDFQKNANKVINLAKRVCIEMKQEAVTLEYNNKIAFITA